MKNMFMNMFQPKEKTQQENTSNECIIYQSYGNSETVDLAKGHDQRKSFATTNSQIRSKSWSLVFGLWSLVKSTIFMSFQVSRFSLNLLYVNLLYVLPII